MPYTSARDTIAAGCSTDSFSDLMLSVFPPCRHKGLCGVVVQVWAQRLLIKYCSHCCCMGQNMHKICTPRLGSTILPLKLHSHHLLPSIDLEPLATYKLLLVTCHVDREKSCALRTTTLSTSLHQTRSRTAQPPQTHRLKAPCPSSRLRSLVYFLRPILSARVAPSPYDSLVACSRNLAVSLWCLPGAAPAAQEPDMSDIQLKMCRVCSCPSPLNLLPHPLPAVSLWCLPGAPSAVQKSVMSDE